VLLVTLGILSLGYCAYVWFDAQEFQQRESYALETTTPVSATPSIGPDGLVGRIVISRLNVSIVVMEGTDHRTLGRAAGHIAGTALPGLPGNIGISAHRDTFFRPLRQILPDDLITLETSRGAYRYRVVSTKIVPPTDLSVLATDGSEVLTLVTCSPFYFIGPAPSRFIVRAERIS
jgi:sortase A